MATDGDSTNQPLAGVVLCCTSILADVRTKLADAASQMGAALRLDLTSDVTHLLVGKIDTPKYRYVAKERPDIKVLRGEWVEAVRTAWMAGDEEAVDVAALESEHALPLFFGLKLCVTKFERLETQAYFSDKVTANGGTFSGDLTRDVTHLIAAVPQGAKYTHAKQWGIAVVSEKWFEDSIQRGMVLDESLYPPEAPVEEQGVGAFRAERKPAPATNLGKRGRVGEEVGEAGKRKVRRVASMRLEGQSQDLWQGLSGQEVRAGRMRNDVWKDDRPRDEEVRVEREETTAPDHDSETADATTHTLTSDEPQGLFSGQYILIHGFEPARADRIRDFLIPNGARVVRTVDELERASGEVSFQNRCLLTPHAMPDEQMALPDIPPGTLRTTEWWVERCIHYKRLLDPDTDVLSKPLGNAAVSGLGGTFISTTGFTGVDLRQTAEAVKLIKAEYQETLLPSTQILVCATETVRKEKAFYASKHKIPVVRADWLWDTIRARKRVPVDEYELRLPVVGHADFSQPLSARSPAPGDAQARGAADAPQRTDERPKRLSSSRRRHATPSLMLQPSKSEARARGPFIHEDEDNDDPVPSASEAPAPVFDADMARSQEKSQPLREISPNSSPKKDEIASIDKVLERAEKPPTENDKASQIERVSLPRSPPDDDQRDDGQGIPAQSSEHLVGQLTRLMEQRRASRPDTNNNMSPQKRKSRPLGRNLSGIGNRSVSASARSESMSRTFPSEIPESLSPADGFGHAPRREEEAPSTQLGYETLEMEAHRKQMSKKMGTDLSDVSTGKRLASLGTVKDSELVTRKTVREQRTKGRQRQQMKS